MIVPGELTVLRVQITAIRSGTKSIGWYHR